MPGVERLSLEEALALLLTHPSGVLLRDLLIPINMLDDGCYFGPLCKVIAKHGAPALRSLHLGQYRFAGPRVPKGTDYNYEISWTSFGDIGGRPARIADPAPARLRARTDREDRSER